jgi:hypothetical protein
MKHAVVGTFVGLGLAILVGSPLALAAQEPDFVFSGVWIGEFDDKTEPERDMATTGVRDRTIVGDGRSKCEGAMSLTFQGANNNLSGAGEVVQTCEAMRSGSWQIPREALEMSDFEFKDKGEGKDKELRFQFNIRARVAPGSTGANELVRCEAKGKYKPKDDVFEGSYSCRHELRVRQSGQRTMAIRIRGEFELTRGAAGNGL